MKHILLSLVCCLLSVALNAQGLSEQKIIEKMASAAATIKTVQCNFTQTKHMKLLKEEMVSKGKMSCQQPDKLRWEYTYPVSNTLILNGTKAKTFSNSPVGEKSTPLKGGVAGSMARMIMNSVAGKYLSDSKTFQVSAKEMPTEYVATLLPLRKDMKRMFTKLVLHFDLNQSTVTQVEMYEKSGDRTVIELHDISINKPINAETFVN